MRSLWLNTLVIGIVVVTTLTLSFLAKQSMTTADIAKSLPSNQWYALAYNGLPIGHVHHTFRWHPESGFSFTEELQFKLGTDPMSSEIVKRFHFAPDDPHHLIHASREYLGNANSRIDVTRVDDQLIANADDDTISMVGAYKLEDFIKLKRWHTSKKLRIHESISTRELSLREIRISSTDWVVESIHHGVTTLVQANSAVPAQVTLDLLGDIQSYKYAGGLTALRSDEKSAKRWRNAPPLLPFTDLSVPVDSKIEKPRQLSRLIIRVASRLNDIGYWSEMTDDSQRLRMDTSFRRQSTKSERVNLSQASAAYPTGAFEVRSLANKVRSADAPANSNLAFTLVHFINDYLDYVIDIPRPRGVGETIKSRSGDCTEFADLYTALARSLGMPAKTIVGLAYDSKSHEFRVHAWNEVDINGVWHAVDPTWNQTSADATHIPFPSENTVAVLQGLPFLQFEVEYTEYVKDT